MKFVKVKIGYELLIPVLIVIIVPMIWPFFQGVPTQANYALFTITILCTAFVLYLFYGTRYAIVNEKMLHVQAGFLYKVVIDISRIRSLENSRSLMSAPAPSLDRMEIAYDKYDSILISPEDKKSLVKDLLAINPNIQVKSPELLA